MSGADHEPEQAALVNLNDSLHAREVIAQAQGVLMQRDGITAEAATTSLHRRSREADIPERRLATNIVAATGGPTRSQQP